MSREKQTTTMTDVFLGLAGWLASSPMQCPVAYHLLSHFILQLIRGYSTNVSEQQLIRGYSTNASEQQLIRGYSTNASEQQLIRGYSTNVSEQQLIRGYCEAFSVRC